MFPGPRLRTPGIGYITEFSLKFFAKSYIALDFQVILNDFVEISVSWIVADSSQ